MESGKHLTRAFMLLGMERHQAGQLARHLVANCADIVDSDALALRIARAFMVRPTAVRADGAANLMGAVHEAWKRAGVPFDPNPQRYDDVDDPKQLELPISPEIARQFSRPAD